MSKFILFVGAVLAMGLTWLFGAFWFAERMLSVKLEGAALVALAAVCVVLAAYPAWRFFISPKRHGSS
jgi:hypothetical protein